MTLFIQETTSISGNAKAKRLSIPMTVEVITPPQETPITPTLDSSTPWVERSRSSPRQQWIQRDTSTGPSAVPRNPHKYLILSDHPSHAVPICFRYFPIGLAFHCHAVAQTHDHSIIYPFLKCGSTTAMNQNHPRYWPIGTLVCPSMQRHGLIDLSMAPNRRRSSIPSEASNPEAA